MNDRNKNKLELVVYFSIFVVLSCILIHRILGPSRNSNKKENFPITNAEIIDRVQFLDSIPVDTVVSIIYRIVNTGQDSLRVLKVSPDCSCTDFSVNKPVIDTGDTTYITLKYNSQQRLGENKINAIIKLNIPKRICKITAYINVIEREN